MNNANILKPSIRTKLSKSKAIFLLFFALFSLALFLPTPAKAASFEAGRIIDDSIFVNKNSMSVADIQNFLNSKVPTCDRWHAGFTGSSGTVYSPPWTCLKEYNENPTTKQNNIGQFNPDGSPVVVPGGLSAAQIIWNAAQTYSINPQVILVTLQKETGLITDDWAASWQYRTAMGFGCPDGAPCDAQWFGFANQVAQGTRHFRNFFDGVRSGGFWTPTLPGVNTIGYNPNSACGSSSVNITTRAAAALYSYTPYQPNAAALNNLYGTGDACSAYGNRNFWRDFTGWFGSTIGPIDLSCKNTTNIPGIGSGGKVIANRFTAGQAENLTLTFMNNTGSKCIELHTWGNNYNQWITNVATNHPVFDPADGEVISGNLTGDNKSEMIFVKYRNTGSGKIEIHIWNPGYQKWITNIATSYPSSNPADFRAITSDINGDGIDEVVLIKYRNTGSGKIEMHAWNPGYQTWMTNIATTMPIAESDNGYIISGNPYGESKDRLMFVKYQNTGSGKIEIHTWNPGYQTWSTNIATNHPAVSSSAATVIAADAYKEGRDRLIFVKYSGTGSGKIEIHIWNPGYQTWATNIATNYPSI